MRSIIDVGKTRTWTAAVFVALILTLSCVPASPRFLPLVPREFEASVQIGGIRQHVLIRGPVDAPILILVHGAPGVNENPLFRQYLPELERSFQVVYWEQRGAGKSILRLFPLQTLNVSQFTRDLGDLVEFTLKKYGQEKVYILAHSWGTVPGALYAQQHPERVAAYIGISPMVDVPASEQEGWEWALAQARAAGNEKAVVALERIGPPPHDADAMLISRKWVEQLGGIFHQKMRTRSLLFAALKDSDTNIADLVAFGGDNRHSLNHMWAEVSAFRLPLEGEWEAPVVFISGKHDHITSPTISARYFASINASCKKWVMYEESAHNPHFEEPSAFVNFLTVDLIPWTKTCHANGGEMATGLGQL